MLGFKQDLVLCNNRLSGAHEFVHCSWAWSPPPQPQPCLPSQVSEVYKLRRETYHHAQDYFDRFMATQRNVFKSRLQLIGITCLFIAAKVEVSVRRVCDGWFCSSLPAWF